MTGCEIVPQLRHHKVQGLSVRRGLRLIGLRKALIPVCNMARKSIVRQRNFRHVRRLRHLVIRVIRVSVRKYFEHYTFIGYEMDSQ